MNICILGNQDNSGYRFCKWLRDEGHKAELFMMEKWESPRSMPECIDSNLKIDGYPEWIHRYNNTFINTIFGDSTCLSKIESDFDVVIVIGSIGMMNAYHINAIPFVNISTGPSNQGVIRMWDHLGLKYRCFWTAVRFFVRKSVRKCRKIFVHYDPEIYSLAKLGQLGKIVFYGMPEDVAGNADRVDSVLLNELNQKYKEYSRVFLWLSRIAFVDSKNPMYKGTDKFIEAAEQVIAEGSKIRIILGRHGEDYQQLLEIIDAKGLSGHIDWVDHMPYWKLLTYLSIQNAVVFDELTSLHCVSSGMFRETLSVGGILVRSFSPTLTRAGHGGEDCPVLHAESSEEVYGRMQEILAWDLDTDLQWREKVREWSAVNLDRCRQIKKMVNMLGEVVYAHRTALKLKSWYE